MRVLVFDTETTGLLPKKHKQIFEERANNSKHLQKNWYTLYPYIVQCSWIIYDTSSNTIEMIEDHIIKLPNGILIPDESSKIHGITNDIMLNDGILITEVLELFVESLYNIDLIIAHNIEFDSTMLQVEFARNQIINHIALNKKKMYCTMKNTIEFCAIERISTYTGRKYFKYPQLNELHNKIFGYMLNNLHNSLYDVIVCLRCYMYFVHNIDILNSCEFIRDIYKTLV